MIRNETFFAAITSGFFYWGRRRIEGSRLVTWLNRPSLQIVDSDTVSHVLSVFALQ